MNTVVIVINLCVILALFGVEISRRTRWPAPARGPWACDRCHCAYSSAAGLARHVGAQHDESFLRSWDDWLHAYEAAERSAYR